MISSHWKTFLPLTLLLAVLTARCREDPNAGRKTPVVRWTAGRDTMNFRYEFLENIKTTTLLTHTGDGNV
ncbi:MAG: hypothetical protein ACYTEQ_00410 [Planctomycetota bacterium]|jgi:hypothetical protein